MKRLLLPLSAVLLAAASANAATPLHRYSFDEGAGTTVIDSIGGANGIVKGAGSAWNNPGQLRLPGGSSSTQAYVDLPNGLISGLNGMTLESWHTPYGSDNWGRVWDFGSSNNGEVFNPGGGGQGTDYLLLSNSRGTNINQQRVEWRNIDPVGGSGPVDRLNLDTNIATPFGVEIHSVVTVNPTGPASSTVEYYRNGVSQGSTSMPYSLSNINDVNNWLGRSNWTGDANINADYNEFRIYEGALQPWQVAIANVNGPNLLIPEPSRIGLLALGATALLFRRRRK